MRHLIAAALLASGIAGALPAAAEAISWSGPKLVFTPLSGSRCRLAVERTYLQGTGWGASIHVVFRNYGTAPVNVAADVDLRSDPTNTTQSPQRKISQHGPFTIATDLAADRDVMQPYGGSLTGSVLRVTITGCTPAAG